MGYSSWCRRATLVIGSISLLIGLISTALPAMAAQKVTITTAPPTPVLNWHPCVNPLVAGFECATAKVPLDYTQPQGATISLAVIKHPATHPAQRIGSLFFNPGGPGGSGTEDLPAFYSFFPAELQQDFDLTSWDLRGIGQSTAVAPAREIESSASMMRTSAADASGIMARSTQSGSNNTNGAAA